MRDDDCGQHRTLLGLVIEEVGQCEADGSWCEGDTGQGCALERREGFEGVSNARYSG